MEGEDDSLALHRGAPRYRMTIAEGQEGDVMEDRRGGGRGREGGVRGGGGGGEGGGGEWGGRARVEQGWRLCLRTCFWRLLVSGDGNCH